MKDYLKWLKKSITWREITGGIISLIAFLFFVLAIVISGIYLILCVIAIVVGILFAGSLYHYDNKH